MCVRGSSRESSRSCCFGRSATCSLGSPGDVRRLGSSRGGEECVIALLTRSKQRDGRFGTLAVNTHPTCTKQNTRSRTREEDLDHLSFIASLHLPTCVEAECEDSFLSAPESDPRALVHRIYRRVDRGERRALRLERRVAVERVRGPRVPILRSALSEEFGSQLAGNLAEARVSVEAAASFVRLSIVLGPVRARMHFRTSINGASVDS